MCFICFQRMTYVRQTRSPHTYGILRERIYYINLHSNSPYFSKAIFPAIKMCDLSCFITIFIRNCFSFRVSHPGRMPKPHRFINSLSTVLWHYLLVCRNNRRHIRRITIHGKEINNNPLFTNADSEHVN